VQMPRCPFRIGEPAAHWFGLVCGQVVQHDIPPDAGTEVTAYFGSGRSDDRRATVEWATLDLSTSFRAVFDTMLPDAV
jgi:uncharacterized protein YceK